MFATSLVFTRLLSFQIVLLIYNCYAAITPSWQAIDRDYSLTRFLLSASSSPSHHLADQEIRTQLINPDINRDQCVIYKIVMSQQYDREFIRYKINLPDLREFTLCMWTKFSNHTNDHPLFSYAVGEQPRAILSWIANNQRSSYYMMTVDGHNLYRLNYPLQLNRWYHSCQSWNGRTGEWQIWINDERVGRGFNNRLVGHVIKGNGIAISGQEQRRLDKNIANIDQTSIVNRGMMGEITMLQLYHVALTAGKAHRDHKHHHVHHFEHNVNNVPSSTTMPTVTERPIPMNSYITGGQINHQVKINVGTPFQIIQNGVTLRHPILSVPKVISQQLPSTILRQPTINEAGIDSKLSLNRQTFVTPPLSKIMINHPHLEYHQLEQKDTRGIQNTDNLLKLKRISKRNIFNRSIQKVRTMRQVLTDQKKRNIDLSGESIISESFIQQKPQLLASVNSAENFAGLIRFGATSVGADMYFQVNKDEREPAEEEVRSIMNLCNGCANDPFEKALVIAWRSIPKLLYSGVLHVPTVQNCEAF